MSRVFRQCPFAAKIWRALIQADKLRVFMNILVQEWFIVNIHGRENPGRNALDKATDRWNKPEQNWVKANADGAMGGALGTAAAGGVMCDHHGNWIRGFSRSIGICNALKVELWALHDILVMVWSMGFRKVEVESDCKTAVSLINNRSSGMDGCTIVKLIKDLLAREWEVKVSYSCRETNMVADKLAAMARGRVIGTKIYEEPPIEVIDLDGQERSPIS
ncbi:hypothetical protein F3Y22_tig00000218pilonHSYRG00238 [Hibiscus syriacus]|uniref:RNase H type-1 domain-containing protein n=1 Tax=Hibiscus syriacus TaxID=106335 RepID=A0A6A3D7X1_HIBSY|nr:hypothetical protein F3Y22_tig00000218pilonHSYRG00238 [Hibiscus syriacus]